jgi:7-cyano-7-deazaguanine synthase
MKRKSNRIVSILSGGMDSTTLTYDLALSGNEVFAISFNYQQKHVRELECAKATCKKLNIPHKIVDISSISSILQGSSLTSPDIPTPHGKYDEENMKQTVVPNRNMIMISLATAYAISIGATEVYYGAHAGDHAVYMDCRPEFVSKLQEVIKICDWNKVELKAPYLNLDKGDIAIIGKMLHVDYENTTSCYEGKETPCLKCGSCDERIGAFIKADMRDPIIDEYNWSRILKEKVL